MIQTRLLAACAFAFTFTFPAIADQLSKQQIDVLKDWMEWDSLPNKEQYGSRSYEKREKEILDSYQNLPHRLIHNAAVDELADNILATGSFLGDKYSDFKVVNWRCVNKNPKESQEESYWRFSCYMPFDNSGKLSFEKLVSSGFLFIWDFLYISIFTHPKATQFIDMNRVYTNDVLDMDGLLFCSGDGWVGQGFTCSLVASKVRNLGEYSDELEPVR